MRWSISLQNPQKASRLSGSLSHRPSPKSRLTKPTQDILNQKTQISQISDPLSLSLEFLQNQKTSNSPTSFEHHIATHPQLQSPKEPNHPGFLLFSNRTKERSYKFKSEGDECPENTNNPQNDEPNEQNRHTYTHTYMGQP